MLIFQAFPCRNKPAETVSVTEPADLSKVPLAGMNQCGLPKTYVVLFSMRLCEEALFFDLQATDLHGSSHSSHATCPVSLGVSRSVGRGQEGMNRSRRMEKGQNLWAGVVSSSGSSGMVEKSAFSRIELGAFRKSSGRVRGRSGKFEELC
jgi:hypothetical protein